MNNLPTVYSKPDSPYWWYSWYTIKRDKNGHPVKDRYGQPVRSRIRGNGKQFGLRQDSHTSEQAQTELCRRLGLVDTQGEPIPKQMTLIWLRDRIMKRCDTLGRAKGTKREYRISIEHMMRYFGDQYIISNITKTQVTEFQAWLRDGDRKPVTVNKTMHHIKCALNTLVDDDLLLKNPFKKYPAITVIVKDDNYLTHGELNQFLAQLDKIDNEVIKRYIRATLFTGRRMSELREIRRRDVLFDQDAFRPVNSKSRSKLRRWKRFIGPYNGYNVREDVMWFFEHSAEEYPMALFKRDSYARHAKKVLVDIGRPDLKPHSLRHTFITLMAQKYPLWYVRDYVDHSSITVTEGYFHSLEGIPESMCL